MKKLQLVKVRWKNFLSYGEQWNEVNFTAHNMTLISAKNGNGKSTFLEATTFALFGKTIRKVSKASLVNTKNQKGLLVELQFISNGNKYLVRRGIKPNKFEIYKGKELLNQSASVREYQETLELIIGVDYNTFLQTVIISKTKYTPFMRLDASSRREFVENLLTLTIFGNMNKKQKIIVSDLKNKLTTLKNEYTIAQNNITQCEYNVKSINDLIEQNLTEKKSYINKQIDDINNKSLLIKSNAKKLKDTLFVDSDNTLEKYNSYLNELHKLESEYNSVHKELTKLKNSSDYCTLCGSKLDETHRQQHIDKLESELNELTLAIGDCKVKVDENSHIIIKLEQNNSIEQEIKNLVREIKSNNITVTNLKNDLDSLVVDDSKLIEAKNNLLTYRNKFVSISDNLKTVKNDYENNIIVYDMLKDGGIKASIIDKSIPLINSIVNKNLSRFGFFIDFKLDSEFNETIKQRGIDILSYDNFSEGEKLRIDMAILLAWREVAQLQNNISCNVLLFDEMTDASMDFDGSEILGSLLMELQDTHVFVITHTPEKLENYSDGFINVIKENGYSRIAV